MKNIPFINLYHISFNQNCVNIRYNHHSENKISYCAKISKISNISATISFEIGQGMEILVAIILNALRESCHLEIFVFLSTCLSRRKIPRQPEVNDCLSTSTNNLNAKLRQKLSKRMKRRHSLCFEIFKIGVLENDMKLVPYLFLFF